MRDPSANSEWPRRQRGLMCLKAAPDLLAHTEGSLWVARGSLPSPGSPRTRPLHLGLVSALPLALALAFFIPSFLPRFVFPSSRPGFPFPHC
jgi:hypothetical protein